MIKLLFLALLFLKVTFCLGQNIPFLEDIIVISNGITKKSYFITIISSVEKASPKYNTHAATQAMTLVSRANDWINQYYQERYTDLEIAKISDLNSLHTTWDERSHWILIWQDEKFETLVGSMRFSWPTHEFPRLPTEVDLNIYLPKNIHALHSEYPIGADYWRRETNLVESSENKSEALKALMQGQFFPFNNPSLSAYKQRRSLLKTGNIWEIKNFAVQKNLDDDLVPLLFLVAERTGASYYHSTAVALPQEYLLSCHKKLVPYYTRLGFQLAANLSSREDSQVMKISRADYLDKVGQMFSQKPGMEFLKNAKWDIDFTLKLTMLNYGLGKFPDNCNLLLLNIGLQ